MAKNKKRNEKHEKRVKKLIVGSGLCAIILIVSTYAWFIGMKTVNVSSFDVSIAAIDQLSLSLDGEHWSDTVAISKTTYNDTNVVYEGNTNSWGGTGLIPMSSVGVIDTTASRMILFEKGSLTTTPGGYRLMASRVDNYNEGKTEQNGYVVFDLFIKNLSGNEYYTEMNQLNEEAIYLTTDSAVTVAQDGEANTGIENSVRVAFAQIGRVKATTTDPEVITGITCANTTDSSSKPVVTGICSNRVAQIWEPNDTAHVQNAINWYTTSCKKRIAATITDSASYNGTCGTVADGTANQTYAVSGVINYTDQVDVYDGTDYNSYTASVAAAPTDGKLNAYDTFTDTEKNLAGVARPTFITLAPNSITKVRIYVYIEGQDIDNYDFASLGKKISVAFGFTKERFFDEDVNYDSTNTAVLPDDVIKNVNNRSGNTSGNTNNNG